MTHHRPLPSPDVRSRVRRVLDVMGDTSSGEHVGNVVDNLYKSLLGKKAIEELNFVDRLQSVEEHLGLMNVPDSPVRPMFRI